MSGFCEHDAPEDACGPCQRIKAKAERPPKAAGLSFDSAFFDPDPGPCILADYDTTCPRCGDPITAGFDYIRLNARAGGWVHDDPCC